MVNTLFLEGMNYTGLLAVHVNSVEVPVVVDEEVLDATKHLVESKTPEPKGIPNSALKVAPRTAAGIFAEVFMACLRGREYPEQ